MDSFFTDCFHGAPHSFRRERRLAARIPMGLTSHYIVNFDRDDNIPPLEQATQVEVGNFD